jgi:hypothetical protein
MKLIETKEYKGFRTEFFIMPKTEKFLSDNGIDIKTFIADSIKWHEKTLFKFLKPKKDDSWTPEKETRKNIIVIFYGVVEKLELFAKGFAEALEFNKSKKIEDTIQIIHENNERIPYAVKEMILVA